MKHTELFSQIEESRPRPRCGSLTNEFLEFLDNSQQLQSTALNLSPIHSNIYVRRHSAHNCLSNKEKTVPTSESSTPPTVPKRTYIPPTLNKIETKINKTIIDQTESYPKNNPTIKTCTLPPIPTKIDNNSNNKPIPPIRHPKNICSINNNKDKIANNLQLNNSNISFQYSKIPPAPQGPPPPTPKSKILSGSVTKQFSNSNNQQNCVGGKISSRQDSNVSSDSFSQTSSPSYTTKTIETPLLPPKTQIKHQTNSLISKPANDLINGNTSITKSASTPASLQTIVRFHNGSNMSLHHRIIKDMRRPSSHYSQRLNFKFRLIQIILNAIALFALGIGMLAYIKAYHDTPVEIINTSKNLSQNTFIIEKVNLNPAPGICLPVIVTFCKLHNIPYNFTVFPNYMGHFGQRDAQQELEVYDAVVDVRCYELSALFLCSVFVPKCGHGGVVVRPCRSLCYETKRRCGFFLDVFGLQLPDYLDCALFPESTDDNVCLGHNEVKQALIKSQKPVCVNGFQCDSKRCIPKDWKCDGHVDCKDQTDELHCKCGIGMIHCGDNKCITQEHMCDGIIDCPWGQDERNCLRLSERNGNEGKGLLEVYRPDKENWVPACITHWNQNTSANLICSLLGYSKSNQSRLINITDKNMSIFIEESETTIDNTGSLQMKHLLKQFHSCKKSTYPIVDLICTNYMCGKARKSYSERHKLRIVGGIRSKPGDWPFLTALLGGPEEVFYCAGVLIADQWVLTASHCVGNHSDITGWTIELGITRRHAHSFYGQRMKVKRVLPHPLYNFGIAHDNDVALFQLSSRVTFHEHLLPVCLPPADRKLHPGTVCTVIGWGKKEDTNFSEYEPEVNEVDVPILNRNLCNSWLENRDLNVTDGMICAGYKEGGKDACQGDSGGPLLCREKDDPDRWFVGGIVSWGIKCAHPHLPGVYAYVPKYIPWILKQMQIYSD